MPLNRRRGWFIITLASLPWLVRGSGRSAHFFCWLEGKKQQLMAAAKKRSRRPAERPPAVRRPMVVDEDLERELGAVAEGAGCDLVHAELKGGVLRLFIDREGGVDLGDCQTVSKQVSALLDVLDFGHQRYVLEVSSPGLDRQLYRRQDYERFTGCLVRVTFFDPTGGGKRTVVGRLEQFHPDGEGAVTVAGEDGGESHQIALGDISVARLEIEL